MAFQPKQVTQYQAEHLAELQGDVSETAIRYMLSLIPPIKEDSVIHDNACGSGAVFETIFEANPPSTIQIFASDINPQFVAGCAAKAAEKGWPVKAETMSAQEINYPDELFTHSFTSFAFHCLGDHDKAAKQIYRTLKKGGVAVTSIWTYMPHVEALQKAHWKTRGKDGPMPTLLPLEGFQEKDLRAALAVGGFKDEDIKCYEKNCYLKISDLKRWAQLAWSYLGTTPEGWKKEDEEKWDEAIEEIVRQLQEGDGISKNDAGETLLKMTAVIGVATK